MYGGSFPWTGEQNQHYPGPDQQEGPVRVPDLLPGAQDPGKQESPGKQEPQQHRPVVIERLGMDGRGQESTEMLLQNEVAEIVRKAPLQISEPGSTSAASRSQLQG